MNILAVIEWLKEPGTGQAWAAVGAVGLGLILTFVVMHFLTR